MALPSTGPLPEDRPYYPNKFGRTLLLAMEEVMNRNAVNAVLNLAQVSSLVNNYPPNNLDRRFAFAQLTAILVAIEDLYGPRTGRGTVRRVGHAAFHYGLKEFGDDLGVYELSFRLLPTSIKLRRGADMVASLFNSYGGQHVTVAETDDAIEWRMVRCPMCWQHTSDHMCGTLAIGILEEAAQWASGGVSHPVQQTACIAMGDDACVFAIARTPPG